MDLSLTRFLFVTSALISMNIFTSSEGSKFPIVFFYYLTNQSCVRGFPSYMNQVLEQAIVLHNSSDCEILLLSNFEECRHILREKQHVFPNNSTFLMNRNNQKVLDKFPNLTILVDTKDISTQRTSDFVSTVNSVFQFHADLSFKPGLWLTSTIRFLFMEDLMLKFGYKDLLQVEMDNLIYGDFLETVIPHLRAKYSEKIALTPLSDMFTTASILWIPSVKAIHGLNVYLISLAKGCRYTHPAAGENVTDDTYLWLNYTLGWIGARKSSWKNGGVLAEANGYGLKPASINEMSMLCYYTTLPRSTAINFPVLPSIPTTKTPHPYSIGGSSVGSDVASGIWDPNSWGMYLGGEYFKKKKGFIDNSHIVGRFIRAHNCTIEMKCFPTHTTSAGFPNNNLKRTLSSTAISTDKSPILHIQSNSSSRSVTFDNASLSSSSSVTSMVDSPSTTTHCRLAPFVMCGGHSGGQWVRLHNLHVHTKQPQEFLSTPCQCESMVVM